MCTIIICSCNGACWERWEGDNVDDSADQCQHDTYVYIYGDGVLKVSGTRIEDRKYIVLTACIKLPCLSLKHETI